MQFGNNSIKSAGKKLSDSLMAQSKQASVKEAVNYIRNMKIEEKPSYQKILENRRIIEKKRIAANEFVNDTLKRLTFNALYPIYEECCGYDLKDPKFNRVKKNIVMNFIEANTCSNILNAMSKSKSFTIVELAEIIQATHSLIIEDNKEEINPKKVEDPEPSVSPEIKDTFIDTVNDKKDSDDIEDVSKIVKTYVSTGLQDFIISNIQDKQELENIITDVEDKVDTIKATTASEESAFRESRMRTARRLINDRVTNRKVALFEQMVRFLSRKALKENIEFLKDGNKLNMHNVVCTCEAMYTMMVLSEALGMKVDNDIQKYFK